MPNPSNYPTQITPHFSYRELTRSETARRHGVSNTPSQADLANITYTANQLEKVRAYLNDKYQKPIFIIVTSCFRSEKVNKLVGGSKLPLIALDWRRIVMPQALHLWLLPKKSSKCETRT